MYNLIQKSIVSLLVINALSVLLTSDAMGASFNKFMNLGIIFASSPDKQIVIYNDDYTKCLTVDKQKTLEYAKCQIDSTSTWHITNTGKVKNIASGKCLSTPEGEDSLLLVHCNYVHHRDYVAHDFVIFDHIVEDEKVGEIIADVDY